MKTGSGWLLLCNIPIISRTIRCTFFTDTSYAVPALHGIAIDSSGQVWFNTLSDGILKLGETGVEAYGPEQGVDFQEIQSIVFDKHNRLLVFANSGLEILDTESKSFIYLGEQTGLGYRYPGA